MSITTQLDYDELNQAARVLHDAAYSKGFREGDEKGRHDASEWHMRGNLDLAENMLRRAANTITLRHANVGDRENEAQALAFYARLLLTRTPQMHPVVGEVLHQLNRDYSAREFTLPPAKFGPAADALKAALDELGGYL